MHLISRRAVLMAGGTVAAAALARKSAAAQRLQDIGAMRPFELPEPAPPLLFTDAAGARKSLADFAGQGVLLNLWATWCAPCVAEMPSLDRLAASVGPGLTVLPLSIDLGGAAAVEKFYRAHGITRLGIWLDTSGEAPHVLGVSGIPTTFLIDGKGRERARIEGPVDWSGGNVAASLRRYVG